MIKTGTKNKINVHFTLKDSYKVYVKQCKDIGAKPSSYKVFMSFNKDINRDIHTSMIYENFEFHMPYRLGILSIKKNKPKAKIDEEGNVNLSSLGVDWCSTKKYWSEIYPGKTPDELKLIKNKTLVYYENKHTDGYKMMHHYDKRTAIFNGKNLFQFRATREYMREIKKAVTTNKQLDFFIL